MSYNINADYSEETGDGIILPFVVELDESNCEFNPESGSNQKFSYTVTAKGTNDSAYKDLQYMILGIDENIDAGQIKNISVVINGKSQTVRLSGGNPNVSLVTLDPNTGYSGLKFEFSLSKTDDIMQISFELSEEYGIDSIPVCLYGSKTAKTGLTIGGPFGQPDTSPFEEEDEPEEEPEDDSEDDKKCFDDLTCEKYSYKDYNISVPVSVTPYAVAFEPEVKCIGDLIISPGIKPFENKSDSLDFEITQKISVITPVKFGVKTCYGETCADEDESESEESEPDTDSASEYS